MGLDSNVSGHDNDDDDRGHDKPKDKCKERVFVWEYVQKGRKPAVELVKGSDRGLLVCSDTSAKMVFFLIRVVSHSFMKRGASTHVRKVD